MFFNKTYITVLWKLLYVMCIAVYSSKSMETRPLSAHWASSSRCLVPHFSRVGTLFRAVLGSVLWL